MSKFPQKLRTSEISSFPTQFQKEELKLYRKEIEWYLLKQESFGFDFEACRQKFNLTSSLPLQSKQNLIDELQNLGWKCKLQYGQSVLFIYTDYYNAPANIDFAQEIE